MATVTIGEYRAASDVAEGFVTEQEVTIGVSSVPSAAMNEGTRRIRIVGDGAFRFVIGQSPTALATSQRSPANSVEYLGVEQGKGDQIAIIQES